MPCRLAADGASGSAQPQVLQQGCKALRTPQLGHEQAGAWLSSTRQRRQDHADHAGDRSRVRIERPELTVTSADDAV